MGVGPNRIKGIQQLIQQLMRIVNPLWSCEREKSFFQTQQSGKSGKETTHHHPIFGTMDAVDKQRNKQRSNILSFSLFIGSRGLLIGNSAFDDVKTWHTPHPHLANGLGLQRRRLISGIVESACIAVRSFN